MVKMTFWDKARKDLHRLGRPLRRQIVLVCKEIFDDFAIGKPLTGTLSGYRGHRMGVYRIVYKVTASSHIEIVAIGHRKDIYERMR